nr:MAG TPA: hypothetical protein [Caudoviricetes sp.]
MGIVKSVVFHTNTIKLNITQFIRKSDNFTRSKGIIFA